MGLKPWPLKKVKFFSNDQACFLKMKKILIVGLQSMSDFEQKQRAFIEEEITVPKLEGVFISAPYLIL